MLPDFSDAFLLVALGLFLTCDSSRNDSCTPTKNSDGKRRRIFLCRLVLTPRPWAYIIQNKRKSANTFRFASEIIRHQLAAGFFGRILTRRPWAFC